ncbi:MAG TPA: TIGR03032 family protein, partial [Thermoanaerobaculia bacterium]|nr:TIGR03032 family protein [Thermoanaerobaculia bacterium]
MIPAFDATRLADEARQFEERLWRNGTLPLVSAYGDPANTIAKGPMRPTPHLARCEHVRELLAAAGAPIGRTRFARERQQETSYYALTHETIELPFDGGFLLIDAVPAQTSGLQYESVNLPVVMSPAELESIVARLGLDLTSFAREWRALWSIHGDRPSGWSAFAALRDTLDVPLLASAVLNPDLAPPREITQRRVFIVAPEGSGAEVLAERLSAPALKAHATVVVASPSTPIAQMVARFREAKFVYLYRDPRACVSSAAGPAAPRGRLARGASQEEVASRWATTTNRLLDELEALPADRWCVVSFDRMDLARVCEFLGFDTPAGEAAGGMAGGPPALPDDVASLVVSMTRAADARAKDLFARPPARRVRVDSSFRSVHTSTFAEVLHGLGASLIVTTYQSGRVVLVRADDARTLNTHLRGFTMPMGVAVAPNAIALGTRSEIWDYRNQPDVAAKLQPRRHDACFVPRNTHLTGDIRIHEIAFAGGELWVVNTRFSALCSIDKDHSFVPRWQPPFITALAAEDRCHLNGMAIVEDRVRYATALGETDTDNGWRENKGRGGIVMDVPSSEIVLRGLSMPHSPRWYDGRFYLLESGKGTLASADLQSGRVETIAELPGFTRGLAFAGPFAFVGLS